MGFLPPPQPGVRVARRQHTRHAAGKGHAACRVTGGGTNRRPCADRHLFLGNIRGSSIPRLCRDAPRDWHWLSLVAVRERRRPGGAHLVVACAGSRWTHVLLDLSLALARVFPGGL